MKDGQFTEEQKEEIHHRACVAPIGSRQRGFWVGISEAIDSSVAPNTAALISILLDQPTSSVEYQEGLLRGYLKVMLSLNTAELSDLMSAPLNQLAPRNQHQNHAEDDHRHQGCF